MLSRNDRLAFVGIAGGLLAAAAANWSANKPVSLSFLAAGLMVVVTWIVLELDVPRRTADNGLVRTLRDEHKWASDRFLVCPLAPGAEVGSLRQESEEWAQRIVGLIRSRAPHELVRNFKAIMPRGHRDYVQARDEEHRVFLNQIDIRLEALHAVIEHLSRKVD